MTPSPCGRAGAATALHHPQSTCRPAPAADSCCTARGRAVHRSPRMLAGGTADRSRPRSVTARRTARPGAVNNPPGLRRVAAGCADRRSGRQGTTLPGPTAPSAGAGSEGCRPGRSAADDWEGGSARQCGARAVEPRQSPCDAGMTGQKTRCDAPPVAGRPGQELQRAGQVLPGADRDGVPVGGVLTGPADHSGLYATKRGWRPRIGVAGAACQVTVRQSRPMLRSSRSR